ncbi:hypothetical protein M404DRAFT_1003149 [Pisolithus tinctorius Marx 270]|uniref:Uncharacterized protein n=1 Tax=Pisolithus tinctorius Marx 270 TaxID=870435 RepID=A0A0C3IXA1_PISTI|nr:hypothetical protein M404DRAFT_1003149 [Pisolithus tinctorius Marx 270]
MGSFTLPNTFHIQFQKAENEKALKLFNLHARDGVDEDFPFVLYRRGQLKALLVARMPVTE